MKRIIKTVCAVVVSLIILTHSFIAYAIDFDAEQTFDSVFVVTSGNSLGSGFALGEKCVITNAHVIQDSDNVALSSYDGKTYQASVYCMSNELDIAVLSVYSGDFAPLTIGKTDGLKIGDDVYAIGAPNGMSYTLTKGTLSAKNRVISGETYLQIDAALNEGNSGGPLLNSDGAVIGMNSMKMSNSEGIGLSIPIDRICDYIESNGITISENGLADLPIIKDDNKPVTADDTDSENRVDKNDKAVVEDKIGSILTALLCLSVICNVILMLAVLYYRSKWKKVKEAQSECTDFEIDFWE